MQKNSVAGGFTVKWGEAKYFSVSNFATNKINVPFLVGGICYLWIKTEMSHENKKQNQEARKFTGFPSIPSGLYSHPVKKTWQPF